MVEVSRIAKENGSRPILTGKKLKSRNILPVKLSLIGVCQWMIVQKAIVLFGNCPELIVQGVINYLGADKINTHS